MCVHSWAGGTWSWVLSVREPCVALENGSGFKAERPWVFTPGSCPWFLRVLSLFWRVVAAGTGDDADGVRGGVQQELGKKNAKKEQVCYCLRGRQNLTLKQLKENLRE